MEKHTSFYSWTAAKTVSRSGKRWITLVGATFFRFDKNSTLYNTDYSLIPGSLDADQAFMTRVITVDPVKTTAARHLTHCAILFKAHLPSHLSHPWEQGVAWTRSQACPVDYPYTFMSLALGITRIHPGIVVADPVGNMVHTLTGWCSKRKILVRSKHSI